MSADRLHDVIEAVLLWFTPTWTPEAGARWKALTGRDETTSKGLCDWLRDVRDRQDASDRSGDNTTAEAVVWKALAALHGVPAHLWWDKFQSVLEAHGYVVAHVEDQPDVK